MLQYFNNLPIPKLPNTNVQPDLGSVVGDQVTEYSVDKMHGYNIQQSLDTKAFQHQCLSSQSAKCMVTKFNNT